MLLGRKKKAVLGEHRGFFERWYRARAEDIRRAEGTPSGQKAISLQTESVVDVLVISEEQCETVYGSFYAVC